MTLWNVPIWIWECSGYKTQKWKWTRSSLVTCLKRFASSSAAGGKNARGTLTPFVAFFILIHWRTYNWNWKPSNSLGIISWQRRLAKLMNISFWNYLGVNQGTKPYWARKTDPPVRPLDLLLTSLFSTRHPNQSVSCIQLCYVSFDN